MIVCLVSEWLIVCLVSERSWTHNLRHSAFISLI